MLETGSVPHKERVSVIMAAYNEEPVIAQNIERVLATLDERSNITSELVLVNDGSTDRTGEIIKEAQARYPNIKAIHLWRNFGQGKALRTGFDIADGEVLVTIDADLSYGPDTIWRLYDALLLKRTEIVLASAYSKGGSVRNVPLHRRLLSVWGNRYLSWMSDYNISTSTCVVRAYRREVMEALFLSSDGMELQLEILMKAAVMGFNVSEIPADLDWACEIGSRLTSRRTSKMKILKTMRLYFELGWLSRPTFLFVGLGLLFLGLGVYMALWLSYQLLQAVNIHLNAGTALNWAISLGLEDVFGQFAYSFFISGILILAGIQVLAFALIFLQNKLYYEDLFRLGQEAHKKIDAMKKFLQK